MARQQSLGFALPLPQHAYEYGQRATGETHGVVLTKPHIVRLILDLAEYKPTRNLTKLRVLEPSCGEGVFVVEVVRRLLASAKRHRAGVASLVHCLRAYDIDPTSVAATKAAVRRTLSETGVAGDVAEFLLASWVQHGDFLLTPIRERFEVIVGNPPYVRIEQLDPHLQATYRGRFDTLFDRADLYVAFIERSLELLADDGVLSFICADRWTMNRYGAPLRELIAREYGVKMYVDLHQASPFESDVIAYPSIFVFQQTKPQQITFAKLRKGSTEECECLATVVTRGSTSPCDGVSVFRYSRWFEGSEPWVLGTPAQLAALRELEDRYQTLEHDGRARVGIGVATGADEVFIVSGDVANEIEADRLVPLVMRGDIRDGRIEWQGKYVVNTFQPNGGRIDLNDYPKLETYLVRHEGSVRRRHVSQRNNSFWFRTIDRVYPELVSTPKLLIPDIAGSNEVAYDEGSFHPHHNLYFVTSEEWDLEVLGGLLSSKVALFFVWSYAVKMRGGYLRFQAQYLRRIRVPDPNGISRSLQNRIRSAFRARDFAKLDGLALRVYGIDALPDFAFVDTRR